MTDPNHGPLRVGIGGPVGSGKTALMEHLCKAFRDRYDICAITNDIYTKEDALILNRAAHEHRITTGAEEPCLLAYAWTGVAERLSTPGMKFSARRKVRIKQGI